MNPTPCSEDPHHGATVFCVNCEVDFCETCYAEIHSRKSLQSHKKLSLSEKKVQLPKCSIHPYNIAKFKCQESSCSQPSKLFCNACSHQEHKGHSYELLQETVAKNQQELENLKMKICAKMRDLEDSIQRQDETTSRYKRDSELVIATRNNLIEQFEEKKRKELFNFDSGVDYTKQKSRNNGKDLERQERKVLEVREEIERILESKTNLFCIEDVAKRAKDTLNVQVENYDPLNLYGVTLDEKMELKWG